METKIVYWRGKFDGKPVIINTADFNAEIHSETPWADDKDAKKGGKKADDKDAKKGGKKADDKDAK